MNLIRLIFKNLKIIFRNKVTSFVLILGPLLIILIAGLAFNNSLSYDIKLGVFSEDYSELSSTFVSDLEKDFIVTKFPREKDCIDSIKSRGYHACLVIPPNLEIKDGVENDLGFYFDNSRVNIVSAIKQGVFNSIDKTSSEISENYTSRLIGGLILTEKELGVSKGKIDEGLDKVDHILSLSQTSDSLLKDTDLNIDLSDLSLSNLKNESLKLKEDYAEAKDLAHDGIDLADEMGDNVSGYSTEISELDERYDNITSNESANAVYVYDNVKLLVSRMETVSENLGDAKEKTTQVSSNLDVISEDGKVIEESLNFSKESMNKVLADVGKNSVRDASKISSPVNLKEHEVVVGSKLNYMFPNLIILVIMFITIITSATQVINEKLNKARVRMQMTPNLFLTNVLATFFTILMITIIQLVLILLLTQYFFGIDILTSLLNISIVLLFSVVFFTLLGISIGLIFNTEHTVMLGAISVSSFFFILSDLILPIESMPSALIKVMNYTPFILSTELLRKVMFFGIPISSVKLQFYSFVAYSFALLLLIAMFNGIFGLIKYLFARKRSKKVGVI